MVLRLVLVGLVTGLGVSLPSRHELETLSRSAQRWVHARIAEWDSQAADTSTFVFVPELSAPAPSEASQPVVSDQQFLALVEDTVAAFAQDAVSNKESVADEPAKAAAEIAPGDTTDSLAIAPPVEPAMAAADEPAAGDLAFRAIVEEMASTFAVDLAALDSAARSQLALEALMEEITLEFSIVASATELVEAPRPAAPASEALGVDQDLYPGEAYALNRLSDGLAELAPPVVAARPLPVVAAEPAPAAEPVSRQSRLTRAVRLTREAVVAWTSLLHGPAVVAISH